MASLRTEPSPRYPEVRRMYDDGASDEEIAEQLGVGTEEIKPESLLVDDLGADSLDVVEIGILLQTNFALDAWALPDWSLETTLAEVERDLAKVLPAAPSKSSVTE